MNSRDFVYWLQGYFEISDPNNDGLSIDEDGVGMIRKHLALVFKHEIDPSYGDEKKQAELNKIHAPSKPTKNSTKGIDGTLYRC